MSAGWTYLEPLLLLEELHGLPQHFGPLCRCYQTAGGSGCWGTGKVPLAAGRAAETLLPCQLASRQVVGLVTHDTIIYWSTVTVSVLYPDACQVRARV